MVKFKTKTIKEKQKKEIIAVDYCQNISFDMAKYLSVKEGCGLRFYDKKGNLCFKDKAVSALGYAHYEKMLAIITPVKKIRLTSLAYPVINKISLNKKIVDLSKYDDLIKDYEKNFFDYSLEAYHIWGPMSLIPKGYKHITEGEVKKGDYVFNDHHWLNVEISFSPAKVGKVIKIDGVHFVWKHGGRVEDEHLEFYDDFIIRKSIE